MKKTFLRRGFSVFLVLSLIFTSMGAVFPKTVIYEASASADTSVLDARILYANSLYSSAIEGTDLGNYQPGSKEALLLAINQAQFAKDNFPNDQGVIDSAVINLNLAIDIFEGNLVTESESDSDEDQIIDEADNCPFGSNPDQTDTDGDGEGDVCDSDDDNDQVDDEIDNCVDVPNNDQADANENGIGDACEGEEDDVPPFITILGLNPVTVFLGDTYSDAGAQASDDRDGDISENIEIHNNVNISQIGSYSVTYDVSDSSGNEADQKSRTVNVVQRSSGGSVVLPRFVPKNVSIVINADNEKTASREVALSIIAEDAAMMAISNSSSFDGSVWEKFSSSKEWKLTDGNGLKTVYAKFKNNKGTESAFYTDTITLATKSASDDNGQVLGDSTVNIYDGDLIQCKGCADPGALYVVKIVGDQRFIRHIKSDFFKYYKDYSWDDVKEVPTLEGYTQSRWIRVNTGINGIARPTDKVYEVNGDWTKHWLDMTKEQFYARGGSEAAVFSVNIGELNSYPTGPKVTVG